MSRLIILSDVLDKVPTETAQRLLKIAERLGVDILVSSSDEIKLPEIKR
jgi:hypothetical protein